MANNILVKHNSDNVFDPIPYNVNECIEKGFNRFIFLDFDGVFNSLFRCGKIGKEYYAIDNRIRYSNPFWMKNIGRVRSLGDSDYRRKEPKTFEIWWSNELVEEINEIIIKPDTLVVWLTAWFGHSKDIVEYIGVKNDNPMFYLPWGNNKNFSPQDEKIDAIQSFFQDLDEEYRGLVKVVWVDDQVLTAEVQKQEPLRDFVKNVLYVGPDGDYGISRDDMQRIKDFLLDDVKE